MRAPDSRSNISATLAADPSVFEYLLDNMHDVITVIADSGQIVYQSKSIESMLGYQPGPMIGTSVASYIHSEDLPYVQSTIETLLSGQHESNQAEFRFRHHNGDYRRIHAVARPWNTAGVRGILVNSRDITESFEAQQALARQNELLEKTFAVSKNLLSISIPASGEMLQVNDAWCDTLRYSREEVIGKTSLELGIWGTRDNRQRVLREFEQRGRLQKFESYVYTSSGEERLVVIDAQLLIVGDQPKLLMACTDVTDSRQTEEELRQSQKMDAVGRLTGGVAHDFNNLIGVTMGNAELLLDIVADRPAALNHAQQIFAAAERGATLTQQLLAFSRRQTLSPEPVDLAEHLEKSKQILQTSVSENTVLEISSEPGLWHCQVDPNQLQTALLNITLNAHDAMPTGGLLKFHMSNYTATGQEKSVDGHNTISEMTAGDYVALRISDTGLGMDRTTRLRAFEPFFTTKENGRGTGLGLSMVFGFIEQTGGALCLDSEPGSGTTLILLLPRAMSQTANSPPTTKNQRNSLRRYIDTPKTVLVVEDNDALRSVLVRSLSDLGYRVREAAGESELKRVLEATAHVDLMLCDVILRDRKRGPELADDVRKQHPESAVLLMTGFSPNEVLKDSTYPVLKKPFTLTELSEVVRDEIAANEALRAACQ